MTVEEEVASRFGRGLAGMEAAEGGKPLGVMLRRPWAVCPGEGGGDDML